MGFAGLRRAFLASAFGAITGAFSLVVMSDGASAQCSLGLDACAPGRWGRGGCFNATSARCLNGVICTNNREVCPPGGQGPGGCFEAGKGTCQDGRTCEAGQAVCLSGERGSGGCFSADKQICVAGRICASDDTACSGSAASLSPAPGKEAVPPRTAKAERAKPAAPPAVAAEASADSKAADDGACGSLAGADRRAVMDALRPPVEKDLGPPIIFVVSTARICGDWAFVIAEPKRPSGKIAWQKTVCAGDTSHLVGGLARRNDRGAWQLVTHALCPSDVAWADWSEKHKAPAALFEP